MKKIICDKIRILKSKIFLSAALTFLIFLSSSSCEECDDCIYGSCEIDSKVIKKVSNLEGRVIIGNNEYKIIVSYDGTYDSQDILHVCDNLPEEFRKNGSMVLFSGTYREFDGDINGPLPGQINYYLDLSKISILVDK